MTITRVFEAPRERVWQAWTEPEHLMGWWGPKHFFEFEGMLGHAILEAATLEERNGKTKMTVTDLFDTV